MARHIPASLQKLEGTSHDLAGLRIRFEQGQNGRPAAWAGGEGFAAPVYLSDGEPHFLKIYRLPTPERQKRASFLAALDLGRLPLRQRVFHAAPTRPVRAEVQVPEEGPLVVEGHLAPSIPGQKFEALMLEGWDPPFEARIALARQLAIAVEVLEGGGIAHGDLSGANVMVVDAQSAHPELRLIDFDGFFRDGVPSVPPSTEKGGRAWGTPGYRAPAFKRGSDACVTSDRVALAVLLMEIMTLRHDDDLGRDTFLDQANIDARAPQLPDEIVGRWRAGWDLVCDAIDRSDPSSAPAPARWRAELNKLICRQGAIDLFDAGPVRSQTPSFLALVREFGKEDRQVRLREARGSFAQASDALGWLSYEMRGRDGLCITGALPPVDGRASRLFVRHGGRGSKPIYYEGDVAVDVKFGDVLIWDDCQVYLG